eukprot:scaffold290_cov367-Pinguiococcus_pyrenoidosus.AAC.6
MMLPAALIRLKHRSGHLSATVVAVGQPDRGWGRGRLAGMRPGAQVLKRSAARATRGTSVTLSVTPRTPAKSPLREGIPSCSRPSRQYNGRPRAVFQFLLSTASSYGLTPEVKRLHQPLLKP